MVLKARIKNASVYLFTWQIERLYVQVRYVFYMDVGAFLNAAKNANLSVINAGSLGYSP